MKKLHSSVYLIAVTFFIAVVATGCTTRFFIPVNYRLPTPVKEVVDKTVSITTKDMRSDKTILGSRAAKDFEGFTGLFSLTVDKEKKGKFAAGGFELLSLFKAAFSHRMEDMGIRVLKDNGTSDLVIEVALQTFFLDLVDRKWTLDISYEASLIEGDRLLAKEKINGKAERVKVWGVGEAERVIGDLFTSVVNDLDIRKLFDMAKQ